MAKTSSPTAKRRVGAIIGVIVLGLAALAGFAVYQVRASASAARAELTLDPNQFEGETRQAYLVAQQHPELLAQLHCYCGCEQHEGHKNLLDCFRTTHGAGCETCVGEAVLAGQLAEGGMPAAQIRAVLHDRFAHGS
jgi:Protein of unknown function with PCYCGC motif